jgi:hypothetical protein
MKRGVFYIAFGKNFIKEVILSAESVKQNCGDIHITLFSDTEVESEFIDDCRVIDVQHIRPKVDYISESPYEQTIFLDSDTMKFLMHFRKSIPVLWSFLKQITS